MSDLMPLLPRLLICFALGSIPFAVIAMRGTGVDILRAGSRNPGFNNVLRFSRSRAILTLLGDLGKGALAVWLFHNPGGPILWGWLYGFAVVFGHCYSPFLKFNGGKGIATSAGVMLLLYPRWAAVCLTLFVITRITGALLKWTEAGAIASLSAWFVFTLILLRFEGRQDALLAAAMMMFIAWRHKRNFQILVGMPQPQP